MLSLADVKDQRAIEDDLFARRDAKKIGGLVKAEIQKNFNDIVRLDTAKRLPIVERKAFGVFLRKWFDFNFARDGKYTEDDFVALVNFREANKRFTERLTIFDQMAKTPLKQPVAVTSMVQFHPPGSQAPDAPRPWGWLLGLGLGLAGLSFITNKIR